MQKLKIIKRELKKRHLWSDYKKKFAHRQMRLLFSKITIIFVQNVKTDWLLENEQKILNAPHHEMMFIESFMKISTINKDNYDWKSFGYFIWYIFQTSTFFKDQKKGIANIFNEHNYVAQNAQKRRYYYQWLESINPQINHYNELIKQVLKCVF